VIRPKANPSSRGTSEIELALAKPIGTSKNFCFLDVSSSSHGPHNKGHPIIQTVSEHASRVVTFDNLDADSSPDFAKPHRLGKLVKCRLVLMLDPHLFVLSTNVHMIGR
jgi:hypothetical protein